MKMIFDNAADRAIITASPEFVSTLPVTNLQTQYREELARTASLLPHDIILSWATATPISALVFYRNNLSTTATMRFRIYDSPPGVSQVLLYDSGAVSAALPKSLGDLFWGVDPLGVTFFDEFDHAVAALWLATTIVGRYAVLTIADSYNVDGYMQASRLFVGLQFQTTYAPAPGASLQWSETTTNTRTEGGSIRSEPGVSYRALNLQLRYLPEADRRRLSALLRDVGMRGDLYVSLFAGLGNAMDRDHQMQAKLVRLDPTVMSQYAVVDQTLQFEEV